GGPLKNADGLSGAAEMRIHVAEQREVSVVILSRRGDVSEHLEGASVITELKIRRRQIVSGIVRAGIGPQSCLEVLDRLRIHPVARQQDARAQHGSSIAAAQLVKLVNHLARLVRLAELEMRLGQQVKVARIFGMPLDLLAQLPELDCRPVALRQGAALALILEQ